MINQKSHYIWGGLASFVLILGSATALTLWNPQPAPPLQTPIPASEIPKFVEPLPILDATGAANGTIQTIVAGKNQIDIEMREFKSKMLPDGVIDGYEGTWVWGYVQSGTNIQDTRDTYTGPVIVATRDLPTQIKYVNKLGTTETTHLQAYNSATDQSLHWANPNMVDRYIPGSNLIAPWLGNPDHYTGAIPAAVHLHGAEDPAAIDGGPESWFTDSVGGLAKHGPSFYSMDNNKNGNYAIYRYPNTQEAAPLWFHDHTLGATRLNVYMGLAGAYALIDPKLKLPKGLNATGLRGGAFGSNPADDTLIPLVIQDRMFDQNGQLYFPSGPNDPVNPSLNPEHAYWAPEFFGEVPNISSAICVNGKTWPYLEVKAQRYRFLLINGSNARSYLLSFNNHTLQNSLYTTNANMATPLIWQIGTDQGYLDAPVGLQQLRIMPGERAEFVIDFSGLTQGTTLVLNNFGPDAPLSELSGTNFQLPPKDDWNDPATTGTVMQFRIVSGAKADTSFNPAARGANIRSGSQKILRLVNPATGKLAGGVKPDLTRALTLNEIAHDDPRTVEGLDFSGGPLEILVNNTKWMGARPDDMDPNNMMGMPVNGGISDGNGNYLTELPQEGDTEVWEIINTTMDAHPIHTHLAQFQLLNRQAYDLDSYLLESYEPAFPSGVFKPAYGPPLSYKPSKASGWKYGGNPDVTPYLLRRIESPDSNEAGWKDTVMVPPGMVTRIVVRWAPTDIPILPKILAGFLHYNFVPNDIIPGNKNAIFDYVWHCHIVDHEDNEMMRPDAVVLNPWTPNGLRSYKIGRDY